MNKKEIFYKTKDGKIIIIPTIEYFEPIRNIRTGKVIYYKVFTRNTLIDQNGLYPFEINPEELDTIKELVEKFYQKEEA